jgi:tRNA(fMet)-specific endonuclease VapC
MAASPQFIVDTSLLIQHIRQKNSQVLQKGILKYGLPATSAISILELEIGARRAGRQFEYQAHFAFLPAYPLAEGVLIQAAIVQADLLSQNQAIGILDVLIAATALYHQLPLLSLNHKHFSRVTGLKLLSLP